MRKPFIYKVVYYWGARGADPDYFVLKAYNKAEAIQDAKSELHRLIRNKLLATDTINEKLRTVKFDPVRCKAWT